MHFCRSFHSWSAGGSSKSIAHVAYLKIARNIHFVDLAHSWWHILAMEKWNTEIKLTTATTELYKHHPGQTQKPGGVTAWCCPPVVVLPGLLICKHFCQPLKNKITARNCLDDGKNKSTWRCGIKKSKFRNRQNSSHYFFPPFPFSFFLYPVIIKCSTWQIPVRKNFVLVVSIWWRCTLVFLTLAKDLLDLWVIKKYKVGQDIPTVHLHKTWCHLCTDS